MVFTRRNKVLYVAVIGSLPMMLYFQNCGQQGSIGLSNPSSQVSTGLVIDTQQAIPASSSPNNSNNNDSNSSNNSNNNSGYGSDGGNSYSDDSNNDYDNDDDKNCDDKKGKSDQVAMKCSDVFVSDFLLSVQAVSASSLADSKQLDQFELLDKNAELSIEHDTLRIRARKSMNLKNLFVQLNFTGNKILSVDNLVMDLKTPSATNSGLKVHLKQEASLEADKIYILKFTIVPEDQIVTNSSNCIFKPVIKEASLSAE